ncbi:MAG: orotate phosphoribosyltransferase [Gammaproteobacteria bacterium]|nr:orotate phosphoribosyltransferase [Gammaproteobacteria bacterium]
MIDKQNFVEFLVSQDVLKFGTFTLNSGRQSPYFFNLGSVSSGASYARLGAAYADAVLQSGIEFDLIFGPAYKGIPIAVATSLALAERGVDVGMAYNRKEAKDHGEGGLLVGAPVTGRVLMLDDVLTSGKAIRGAAELIRAQDAEIAGVVIALDRAEVMAEAEQTAVAELAEELGSPVVSIAHVSDVLDYLQRTAAEPEVLQAMGAYAQQYCAF